MNGDRLPDLLFSESFIDENQAFDNNVYWARNLAEAGFSTPITIDEYTEQFGVEFQLVDFDQDQDLDIFYGFLMAESVATWLENDGFGSFTKQTQIINFNVSTPYYVDLHFTHINSDTHLDIAMSVSSLRWLPGDATQQYNEVRKVEFPFGVIPAITVDYDDDNDLDVIEYYPQNEPHSIFLSRNNGDGSFSSAVPIAETDQQLKQVEITDLDGDGFKDILVNPEGLRSDFIVYYGKPDGSYDPPSVLQANVGSTFFQVSDIDQNGTPDIIYGHAVETDIMELEILVNQGAKNYTRQNLTTLTVLQPAEQVAIGDYDGDGRLDIIFEAITGTGKKLFLLKQESALVFTEIDMNVAGLQGFLSQGVQGIDLNQNGKTTFLSRNYSSENNTTTISIIPNEIGQPLVPIVEYSGSALYLPVDYNQDQKVDILYLGGEDVNAVDLRLWSSSLNSYQEIIVQEELPYNTLRMMM
ncbi:MAG: VCBS repeat-containing protein, partial [Bacteroidota bacterium]